MSQELIRLSAADLAAKLQRKEVSSVEATQAQLDRIAAVDGDIHAFLHVDAEGALAAACTPSPASRSRSRTSS
jgi:aspartyl-tRNA(Asn)/glutamyl-tRNA(Gln) amidotransferase subunit A